MLSSRGWERGRPALITQRAARIRARRTLRYWLEGQTATRGCACPTEQAQGQLTAFRLTTTSGNQMNRTGMGCLLENCAVPSEGPRRTLDGYLHGDLRGEIYSIRSQRRRAMGFRSDGSGTQVGHSPTVGATTVGIKRSDLGPRLSSATDRAARWSRRGSEVAGACCAFSPGPGPRHGRRPENPSRRRKGRLRLPFGNVEAPKTIPPLSLPVRPSTGIARAPAAHHLALFSLQTWLSLSAATSHHADTHA